MFIIKKLTKRNTKIDSGLNNKPIDSFAKTSDETMIEVKSKQKNAKKPSDRNTEKFTKKICWRLLIFKKNLNNSEELILLNKKNIVTIIEQKHDHRKL